MIKILLKSKLKIFNLKSIFQENLLKKKSSLKNINLNL